MNPKCPWCGGEITVKSGLLSGEFYFSCESKKCPSNKLFGTHDEALAAASKRFMPKRSMEEIEMFCEKLDAEKKKQWQLCVRDNNMSMEFMDFLRLMQFPRIADYMTGATE